VAKPIVWPPFFCHEREVIALSNCAPLPFPLFGRPCPSLLFCSFLRRVLLTQKAPGSLPFNSPMCPSSPRSTLRGPPLNLHVQLVLRFFFWPPPPPFYPRGVLSPMRLVADSKYCVHFLIPHPSFFSAPYRYYIRLLILGFFSTPSEISGSVSPPFKAAASSIQITSVGFFSPIL